MYVFAVDSVLTAGVLPEKILTEAVQYSQGAIKLALLMGHRPILSDDQVYDCTATLMAAGCPLFRRLLADNHIGTSYRVPGRSYAEALADYLTKPNPITSAWTRLDPVELRACVLGEIPVPASWTSRQGELLEGLRAMDAIPKRTAHRALRPHTLLGARMLAAGRNVSILSETGVALSNYIQTLYNQLPPEERDRRTAWINCASDPAFNDQMSTAVAFGVPDATMALVSLAYNEVVADSVANGDALKTVAYLPIPYSSVSPSELLISEISCHQIFRDDFIPPANAEPLLAPLTDWFTPDEYDLAALGALPWELMHHFLDQPTFANKVAAARTSTDDLHKYLEWLKSEGLSKELSTSRRRHLPRIAADTIGTGLPLALGIEPVVAFVIDKLLAVCGVKGIISNTLDRLIVEEQRWYLNGVTRTVSRALTSDLS